MIFREGHATCALCGALLLHSATLWANATFGDPGFVNQASDGSADEDYCNVASDLDGRMIAVWESNGTPGGGVGAELDIHYAISTDNGRTWGASQALNSNAAADSGVDEQPRIWTNLAGTWMVVWRSTDTLGSALGSDYDILFTRSIDDGASWSPVAPVSASFATDSGLDTEPTVCSDEAGNWVVAWHSDQNAVAGDTTETDDDVLYSRSTDNGASWTSARTLNSDAASDSAVDRRVSLAWTSGSSWLAVWDAEGRSGSDGDLYFSRSLDAGSTWSSPAPLNPDFASGGNDYGVHAVSGASANSKVAVLWYSNSTRGGTGSDYDIFAANSIDGGATWSAPVPVNSNATTDSVDDSFPRPGTRTALAGSSVLGTTYWSANSLNGTIGTDVDVFFAYSADFGQTWQPLAVANTTADEDGDVADTGAVAEPDGLGGWIAMWISAFKPQSGSTGDRDVLFAFSDAAVVGPAGEYLGDADGNRIVDADDFPAILDSLGKRYSCVAPNGCGGYGDASRNRVVNATDLTMTRNNLNADYTALAEYCIVDDCPNSVGIDE